MSDVLQTSERSAAGDPSETPIRHPEPQAGTVYGEAAAVSGLRPDEGETVQGYKDRLVRHFSDLSDDDYDKAMEGRDDLALWVRGATRAYNSTRRGKPKDMPALIGLEEASHTRRVRVGGDRKPRNPESRHQVQVSYLLIEEPGMSVEQTIQRCKERGLNYTDKAVGRMHESHRGITGLLRKHEMLVGV